MRITDMQQIANSYRSPATANTATTTSSGWPNSTSSLSQSSGYAQSTYADYVKETSDFNDTLKKLNAAALTIADITWNQKKILSSDNPAVTGSVKDAASVAKYDVTVSQVAAAQRNDGSKIIGYAKSGLAAGNYTFGITVGSAAEQQLSVQIGADDTVNQVMNKIASAINAVNIGVKASLKTTGTLQGLSLEATATGAANGFSLRDIDGPCIAVYGLGNMAKKGADAIYTVNGTKYQSSSNIVSLDGGNVTLNLNSTTSKKAAVSVAAGQDSTIGKISDLVAQYNHLNSILSGSSNATKSGQTLLAGTQTLVNQIRAKDFASIGLTMSASGTITVDQKKLTAALSSAPDKVKSLFTASNGLAVNLKNISAAVLKLPADRYLSPSYATSYTGYGSSSGYGSTLSLSQYSLLFNQKG